MTDTDVRPTNISPSPTRMASAGSHFPEASAATSPKSPPPWGSTSGSDQHAPATQSPSAAAGATSTGTHAPCAAHRSRGARGSLIGGAA